MMMGNPGTGYMKSRMLISIVGPQSWNLFEAELHGWVYKMSWLEQGIVMRQYGHRNKRGDCLLEYGYNVRIEPTKLLKSDSENTSKLRISLLPKPKRG